MFRTATNEEIGKYLFKLIDEKVINLSREGIFASNIFYLKK